MRAQAEHFAILCRSVGSGGVVAASIFAASLQFAAAGVLEDTARALPGVLGEEAMQTVRKICRGGGPKPPSGISKNARTFGQLDCKDQVQQPIRVFNLDVAPVCRRFQGSEVWVFKIGNTEVACCMKRHQGLSVMATSICLPANRG